MNHSIYEPASILKWTNFSAIFNTLDTDSTKVFLCLGVLNRAEIEYKWYLNRNDKENKNFKIKVSLFMD